MKLEGTREGNKEEELEKQHTFFSPPPLTVVSGQWRPWRVCRLGGKTARFELSRAGPVRRLPPPWGELPPPSLGSGTVLCSERDRGPDMEDNWNKHRRMPHLEVEICRRLFFSRVRGRDKQHEGATIQQPLSAVRCLAVASFFYRLLQDQAQLFQVLFF